MGFSPFFLCLLIVISIASCDDCGIRGNVTVTGCGDCIQRWACVWCGDDKTCVSGSMYQRTDLNLSLNLISGLDRAPAAKDGRACNVQVLHIIQHFMQSSSQSSPPSYHYNSHCSEWSVVCCCCCWWHDRCCACCCYYWCVLLRVQEARRRAFICSTR